MAGNPNLDIGLVWGGQPYSRRISLLEAYGPSPSPGDAVALRLWIQGWAGSIATVDATGVSPLPPGWLASAIQAVPFSHVRFVGLAQADREALLLAAQTSHREGIDHSH